MKSAACPPTLIRASAEIDPPVAPRRTRAVGRIGGLIGRHDPSAQEAILALRAALGPGAQILDATALPHDSQSRGAQQQALGAATQHLVADWDCCWLDDRPVRDLADWQAVLSADRLADVRGAFVLAWIAADGALRLARDSLGERTLFYTEIPGGIAFASTLRALLATGLVPRSLHLPAVASYLSFAYLPGRETLVAGIYELLPGELLTFRGGDIARQPFWTLPTGGHRCNLPEHSSSDDLVPLDEAAAQRELRARLETAVRRRLTAGEPIGATLSGGIDSSLVVALAQRLHDRPLRTFSISFGPEHANELPFSALVAEHCGTQHSVVELSPAAVLAHLDHTIALLSDPIGDPLTVPNALVFREAAREVGAVLNGEGGDPCFGGPKNLPMLLAELYDADDEWSREAAYLRAHQKCYDELPEMLLPDAWQAARRAPLEAWLRSFLRDPRWPQFVARLMVLNVTFKGGHHILPKVDATSAAYGVVARSPLFDRDVVDLAFAVPPQALLRGSVEKHLLKEAVRDLLPASIADRPKSGMLVPVEGWFQGPLLPHARERLLDGLAPYGLFQRDYLERLLAGRLGGLRPRRGAKIWLLVTLEAWLRGMFQARS